MLKILANDGVHPSGVKLLEAAGYTVITDKVNQQDLPRELPKFDVLLVRSATKVRKELIDKCPNLKIIGRGGVGLDNIDVDYAKSKGIHVINTPAASSRAVAELTFGHILSLARFLHVSNRNMPSKGYKEFSKLKKSFANGFQVFGKSLGIIGFGRIGQETAKMGLGLGMKIIPVDPYIGKASLELNFPNDPTTKFSIDIETISMNEMLEQADIITIHVPFGGGRAILGQEEISKMKTGVVLVNTARGGVIDEQALLTYLNNKKILAAALDVFDNEPTPNQDLLNHPCISVSPHIGAATVEAQENIGIELAEQILKLSN